MSNNTAKAGAMKDTSKYREWNKTKEIHPIKYDEQMILEFDIDDSDNDFRELCLEESILHQQELKEILHNLRRYPEQKSK